jgi:hypothetical protein
MPPQQVRPALRRVLDGWTDTPAVLLGRRMDVLGANRLARALYTDFEALPRHERNMARYIFLDESARALYTDWESSARGTVAALHLYAGRHPDDPQLADLVGELSIRDSDFRQWWADHDVFSHSYGSKSYYHPVAGNLTLDYVALNPTGDPDLLLGLHTVEPGSPSEQGLRLLAAWSELDVVSTSD